jgi:parallel beta-helix repeat protein
MKVQRLLVCLLAAPALALAGPLDPPVGPVQSTFKTLTQVEPRTEINATNTPGDANSLRRITQPGSYYLSSNLTGISGFHGIEIAASNVTIDLNGFSLDGVAGSLIGVILDGTRNNIAISNGSASSWGLGGVHLTAFGTPSNVRIENVIVSSNSGFGISAGPNAIVVNCIAQSNTSAGIVIGFTGTLQGCVARSNGLGGFSVGNASTIQNCSARDNTGDGFSVGEGVVVEGCNASFNTGSGFTGLRNAVFRSCSAFSNQVNGFNVTGADTLIQSCMSSDNDVRGINAVTGATIIDNVVTLNTLNGIDVSSAAIIRGNTCRSNGNGGDGAGIVASGGDNRIENNNCLSNDRGIDINGAGNVIIRNTCSGNTTNWDIVANNVFGPILDRTAPASAAVVGNVAASTLGSTDPNANFSY